MSDAADSHLLLGRDRAVTTDVGERVAAVRARLRRLAPDRDIELLAVTKGFGPDAITAAVAAGCPMVGENYAQELLTKLDSLASSTGAPAADPPPIGAYLHFIGNLQSNKVRQLASVVNVWESVDRVSLLAEIAKRQPGATVLIQVNVTGSTAKGGCPPPDVAALVDHGHRLHLRVDGLMTVGPTSGDAEVTREVFGTVRRLATDLGLPTCSMGMTNDLEIAVDCGTTRVRLGTALFGPRAPRSPASAAGRA